MRKTLRCCHLVTLSLVKLVILQRIDTSTLMHIIQLVLPVLRSAPPTSYLTFLFLKGANERDRLRSAVVGIVPINVSPKAPASLD